MPHSGERKIWILDALQLLYPIFSSYLYVVLFEAVTAFNFRPERKHHLKWKSNRQVFRSWSGNGGLKTRSSGYRSTFSTGHVYVGVVLLIGKILHQWIGYDWMIYSYSFVWMGRSMYPKWCRNLSISSAKRTILQIVDINSLWVYGNSPSNLSSKHCINTWVVHGAVQWIAKILFAEAPHRGVPQQNGHLMALESVFCMGGQQSDHHPIGWFWKDLGRMTESLIKLSLLQLTVVQQCSTASTFDSMRSFEITSIAFRFHSVRVPHFRPDVFFQKPNHCRKICSFWSSCFALNHPSVASPHTSTRTWWKTWNWWSSWSLRPKKKKTFAIRGPRFEANQSCLPIWVW